MGPGTRPAVLSLSPGPDRQTDRQTDRQVLIHVVHAWCLAFFPGVSSCFP